MRTFEEYVYARDVLGEATQEEVNALLNNRTFYELIVLLMRGEGREYTPADIQDMSDSELFTLLQDVAKEMRQDAPETAKEIEEVLDFARLNPKDIKFYILDDMRASGAEWPEGEWPEVEGGDEWELRPPSESPDVGKPPEAPEEEKPSPDKPWEKSSPEIGKTKYPDRPFPKFTISPQKPKLGRVGYRQFRMPPQYGVRVEPPRP